MSKPVIPRMQAEDDLDQICEHFLSAAGTDAVVDCLLDFDKAIALISQFPGTGSPRYGYEASLEGMRYWPMKRFPYLIFYVETEHSLDVWRVMHSSMDIQSGLEDPDALPST
ncbi:MAG: type II toxin-antitoxin system RelE/ParE family toxin [Pyrinomonadaceae bacterium]